MKLKKWMSCFALAAFALGAASCSDSEDDGIDRTPRDLQVKVGINENASRSGILSQKFTNGEKIGLYLYKGTGIDNPTSNKYEQVAPHKSINSPYVEDGGFWHSEKMGEGIILSDIVGKLYAYYPYALANDVQDGTAIPITVKSNQGTGISDGTKDDTQTDYMWATPVNGVSNLTTTANFTMNHALTMVSFKFLKGTYPGKGLVSSITLQNGNGKGNVKAGDATMNIATGALKVTANVGQIVVSPNAVLARPKSEIDRITDAEVPRMLTYPTNATWAAGDVQAVVVLDGKKYTLNLPDSKEAKGYEAGKHYQYTFNLEGKEFGGWDPSRPEDTEWQNAVKVTITPWRKVPAGSADIERPDANQ